MKLLMENWREYLKEETVDEAWNPLRRKQKADIDYEVLKRIFSAQLRADELARIVDPESNKDGRSQIDRDYEERTNYKSDWWWGRRADLSKAKPSFYKGQTKQALELMINLYEEEIEPLLSQIITVKNQMESGNYSWPIRHKFLGPGNTHRGIGGVMGSKLSSPDEVILHALKILYAARNKMLGLYKRYYSQAGLEKYTPAPGIHDLEKLMSTAKER